LAWWALGLLSTGRRCGARAGLMIILTNLNTCISKSLAAAGGVVQYCTSQYDKHAQSRYSIRAKKVKSKELKFQEHELTTRCMTTSDSSMMILVR
jgi:hypothetical protein